MTAAFNLLHQGVIKAKLTVKESADRCKANAHDVGINAVAGLSLLIPVLILLVAACLACHASFNVILRMFPVLCLTVVVLPLISYIQSQARTVR